jgi:outer membrane murein-binding lipoprotein Lpp
MQKLCAITILSIVLSAILMTPCFGKDKSACTSNRDTQVTQLKAKLADAEERVAQLEADTRDANSRITDTENRFIHYDKEIQFAQFLFAVFCALWAQNSKRNAWLWFFLGGFFHVVTVIVLLVKNSNDLEDKRLKELTPEFRD